MRFLFIIFLVSCTSSKKNISELTYNELNKRIEEKFSVLRHIKDSSSFNTLYFIEKSCSCIDLSKITNYRNDELLLSLGTDSIVTKSISLQLISFEDKPSADQASKLLNKFLDDKLISKYVDQDQYKYKHVISHDNTIILINYYGITKKEAKDLFNL